MKKKNWYRGFSLADDKYVAEAHPDNVIKPKRKKVFISLVAACACFALIICNLWLFVPFNTSPPDMSRYAHSEYYGLIQKLNTLTFEQPKYKNNAEKLWAELNRISFDGFGGAKNEAEMGVLEDGVASDETSGTGSYQEITDNQVEGIIEADRIKRSDTHIYYLDIDVLRVYSIDKEDTKEVGSYDLYDFALDNGLRNYYTDQWEFYLSSDCKTVTVVTQYYEKTNSNVGRYVNLISLDVSDPANIVKKKNLILRVIICHPVWQTEIFCF